MEVMKCALCGAEPVGVSDGYAECISDGCSFGDRLMDMPIPKWNAIQARLSPAPAAVPEKVPEGCVRVEADVVVGELGELWLRESNDARAPGIPEHTVLARIAALIPIPAAPPVVSARVSPAASEGEVRA